MCEMGTPGTESWSSSSGDDTGKTHSLRNMDTDTTLQIGEELIHTHKDVLCRQSPYFEAMFSGLYKESDCNRIDLTNTIRSKAAFDLVINYMYTGELVIQDDILADIVEVCSILLLEDCKIHCSGHIKYNLNAGNALRYWLIVYMYFEQYIPMYQNLLQACFHNLHIYEEEILKLPAEYAVILSRNNVFKHCTIEQIAVLLLKWFDIYKSSDMVKILREINEEILEKMLRFTDIVEQSLCCRCKRFVEIIRGSMHERNGDSKVVNDEIKSNCEDTCKSVDSQVVNGCKIDESYNEEREKEREDEGKGNIDESIPESEDSRRQEDGHWRCDGCIFETFGHVNLLKQVSDLDTELDVVLVAGPSYEALDHKFDLFSHNAVLQALKPDGVEFLDLSVYIPSHRQWLNIGGIPCSHETLKLSVEFIDRECSIHYCDENIYFRHGSKETLVYGLRTQKFHYISMTKGHGSVFGRSMKYVGSFVTDSDLYCFVTDVNVETGNLESFIVKLINTHRRTRWEFVLGPFMLLNDSQYTSIFDVVTLADDSSDIFAMFITKSHQVRSLFSAHIVRIDVRSTEPKITNVTPLGEFLVEPFHWNICKQSNLLHLVHKATVMYSLDLDTRDAKWRANETHVCLEGHLPSMKNSRCGQLACQSLFGSSRLGLWILATRRIRGKFSVGCLNHVDLSRMPGGTVEEHAPPPYSIFSFMMVAKMPARLLRRFRDVRMYHTLPIWE